LPHTFGGRSDITGDLFLLCQDKILNLLLLESKKYNFIYPELCSFSHLPIKIFKKQSLQCAMIIGRKKNLA
jgi:hypothetical protein